MLKFYLTFSYLFCMVTPIFLQRWESLCVSSLRYLIDIWFQLFDELKQSWIFSLSRFFFIVSLEVILFSAFYVLGRIGIWCTPLESFMIKTQNGSFYVRKPLVHNLHFDFPFIQYLFSKIKIISKQILFAGEGRWSVRSIFLSFVKF